MMRVSVCFLVLCTFGPSCNAAVMTANPIRKVVMLLQNMQKEIEAEGAKEKELYDKFMCYCSGNNGELTTAVTKSKSQVDELTAKLKSETAEKSQTAQDLIQHKKDREAATEDLNEATTLREKEASEFAAQQADLETNLKGLAGAIPALEKGVGGASLMQMPEAPILRKLVQSWPTVDAIDRKNVISFLDQSGDYVPQSGQIIGILKAMEDDMKKNLEETVADEERAKAGFEQLKASKQKEIELASEAIETKTARSGELAVSVVQNSDALEDTEKELADTEAFIQSLQTQCATKEKEWSDRQKLRAEEVSAISEAISTLNDDDALDVFKKAIPSMLVQNEMGFLQKTDDKAAQMQKVQGLLAAGSRYRSPQLKLVLFSLRSRLRRGQRLGFQQFAEVTKMIDDMVTLLGKQQAEDEKQKAWCQDEFGKSADEGAAAQEKLTATEAEIEEITDEINELSEAISTLAEEVAATDKAVAEATENRKEEHAMYVETLQLNEVAVGLIAKAKNRLQKFYNPSLYKAAPKTEMSMEEKALVAGTFVQVFSHSHVAPPPPPETFGAYEKKGEKSAGVMSLMDMLTKELEGDSKDSSYEEKTAQKEYADLMADSSETRASDSKGILDKQSAKATLEEKLLVAKKTRTATAEDVDMVKSYIGDLHVSCDFIMQNFDLRKEARTNEVESLKNAKAVLAGAGY